MDKLKMHTPDLAVANIERMAELFPACVTESRGNDGTVKRAIDFDLLRPELSGHRRRPAGALAAGLARQAVCTN